MDGSVGADPGDVRGQSLWEWFLPVSRLCLSRRKEVSGRKERLPQIGRTRALSGDMKKVRLLSRMELLQLLSCSFSFCLSSSGAAQLHQFHGPSDTANGLSTRNPSSTTCFKWPGDARIPRRLWPRSSSSSPIAIASSRHRPDRMTTADLPRDKDISPSWPDLLSWRT